MKFRKIGWKAFCKNYKTDFRPVPGKMFKLLCFALAC
jgi:hypothetical protein